ncbi:hypothetical protein ANO11243_007970 [Dothideomycetidae sp. 11243]|nr:hypothetical protein ANO11243_007970 [fungal sp. No.11243]
MAGVMGGEKGACGGFERCGEHRTGGMHPNDLPDSSPSIIAKFPGLCALWPDLARDVNETRNPFENHERHGVRSGQGYKQSEENQRMTKLGRQSITYTLAHGHTHQAFHWSTAPENGAPAERPPDGRPYENHPPPIQRLPKQPTPTL